MTADIILRRLKKSYHSGKSSPADPFRVLITTVLSQRTRDEITERAAIKLFAEYATPAELSCANVEEIEELIHEVGFYHVKAPRIKEISRIIHNDFRDRVPERMDLLTSLPGVGRKTANCVLVYGFGRDAIAVDTHVHRVSNRLGLVSTKKPEETETELYSVIPKNHWRWVNELLVGFGKDICRPIKPRCDNCPVIDLCLSGKNAL